MFRNRSIERIGGGFEAQKDLEDSPSARAPRSVRGNESGSEDEKRLDCA